MVDRTTIWLRILSAIIFLSATLPTAAKGQIYELPRPKPASGDFFGTAVAIYGGRALVGATGDDVCGVNSGAAYVYERIEATDEWKQTAELVPSDCEGGRFFGRSVALGENVAVVAASQEFFSEETPNVVYVFEPDSTGSWQETATLTGRKVSSEGAFGTSVSIGEGRILVTTSGDPVGGQFSGVVYLFERDDTGRWELASRFSTEDTSHGILGTAGSTRGDYAVVSASTYFQYTPGSVYFFESHPAAGTWSEVARFGDVDDFYITVDADSEQAIAGASRSGRNASGAAIIFERTSSGEWTRAQTLRPRQPYDYGAFGNNVAIDGEYALIAAYDEQLGLDFNIDRVVYVFRKAADGMWTQRQVIDVGDVAFGASLDVDGGYAIVGSAAEDEPGAVYVIKLFE